MRRWPRSALANGSSTTGDMPQNGAFIEDRKAFSRRNLSTRASDKPRRRSMPTPQRPCYGSPAEMRRERPRLGSATVDPRVPAGSLTPHVSVSTSVRAHVSAAARVRLHSCSRSGPGSRPSGAAPSTRTCAGMPGLRSWLSTTSVPELPAITHASLDLCSAPSRRGASLRPHEWYAAAALTAPPRRSRPGSYAMAGVKCRRCECGARSGQLGSGSGGAPTNRRNTLPIERPHAVIRRSHVRSPRSTFAA